MSASDRYTRTAIALHWAIALLVIFQFAWGWWMQGIPKQPVGPRVDAFNLHKSIGMTIFALMFVRILWRIGHAPPPLVDLPRWQARVARATHALLYIALVVQPLVGYLGSELSGFPVKFFGLTLPSWTGKNAALKDLMSAAHLTVSWVIAATVTLHIIAALKHELVDRNRLLARMGIGTALPGNR
jgi:cytochrome b561